VASKRSREVLNLVSLIIGIVALVFVAIAFIPLLGWANWLVVPLAVIGAGIGAVSRGKAGRNLNLFVIVVGIVRLMLGGGVL
jgi:archaellum biogenesis protein FlaJ (TadC family)